MAVLHDVDTAQSPTSSPVCHSKWAASTGCEVIFSVGTITHTTDVDGEFFAACAGAVETETLCQQSCNPVFGIDDFDPDAVDTYNLRLVLTPETFDGSVAIEVDVMAL